MFTNLSSAASSSAASSSAASSSTASTSQLPLTGVRQSSANSMHTFVHKREVIYSVPPLPECASFATETSDSNNVTVKTECKWDGVVHKHVVFTESPCSDEAARLNSSISLVSDETFIYTTGANSQSGEVRSAATADAPVVPNRRPRTWKTYPREVRDRAIALKREGLTQAQVLRRLRNEYPNNCPSQSTLSLWLR